MKRTKLMAIALAATVSGIMAVVGAGPAQASPPRFTCMGAFPTAETIPAGTYNSLSMPAGSACQVKGAVTVLSPVSLGKGSALGIAGASGRLSVFGPLTVGPQALFADEGNADPILIDGPLTLHKDAAVSIGFEQPGKGIISSIEGPVNASDASAVQIHNTHVAGPVNVQGGGAPNAILDGFAGPGNNFNDLEDNRIDGPVRMTSYTGVWAGIIRDLINGPLTFSDNTEPPPSHGGAGEYDIGHLVINGPATCNDNSPGPNLGPDPGGPSIVHGPTRGDQAATCTGVPGGA